MQPTLSCRFYQDLILIALISSSLQIIASSAQNFTPRSTPVSATIGHDAHKTTARPPAPTQVWHANNVELLRRSVPTVGAVANYSYVGCFFDPGADRLLEGKIFWGQPGNSPSSCQYSCGQLEGYTGAFGLEDTSQCLCDKTIPVSTMSMYAAPDTACSAACPGNSEVACGAYGYINIYMALAAETSGSSSTATTVTLGSATASATASDAGTATATGVSSTNTTGADHTSSDDSKSKGSNGLSNGAVAGVAIAAAAGMGLLVAGLGFAVMRRRQGRNLGLESAPDATPMDARFKSDEGMAKLTPKTLFMSAKSRVRYWLDVFYKWCKQRYMVLHVITTRASVYEKDPCICQQVLKYPQSKQE
ncbi:hypothetical protein M406DRAFT_72086 [Cryphonectria parasitica EP155]|uniref:WSC domain-containing protein n=1 Tax=Cryphonectria parasitica (strain ATCC 38755 / EP155) TaxID=660469 RepID=A0A9P4YA59_CRYP1|nr:uncharacterized protein M406DRAFT_72086 [Cryphonectria parasitica EP155]KAF3769137.1 hypothetical protein M406DRAFT_72086 [Cryphonectria parasitica EP155]